MAFIKYINPFTVFKDFIRTPIESFVAKQYLGYKKKTDEGLNSARELLYKAGVFTVFLSAILWVSIFMYVAFYYTYMPNVTHVRPVHLQFKSCDEHMGVCSFPSAHVQLTKQSHMLMAAQPYRIKLILEMPESQINKDMGMFMVCAQMRAKGGVLVSSSCRSAMLRHRKKMAALKNLSEEQLDILLSFVEENRHLAFGRMSVDNNSQCNNHFKWKELARSINALDMEHPRAGSEYKGFWKELKSRTCGKIYRARQRAKTSKPNRPVNVVLMDYEWRIYNIMPDNPIDNKLVVEISAPSYKKATENYVLVEDERIKKQEALRKLQSIEDSLQELTKMHAELVTKLHQVMRTVAFSPFLLSGINEEKQQLQVELFSDFIDDQSLPVTDAYVELQSRHAQVYGCELHIQAHFAGLRYFMFHWPKVAAVVGISTNLFFVSLVFILSWYHLQEGLPEFVKSKFSTAVKPEVDNGDKKFGKFKLEKDDASMYFEDESILEELQRMQESTKKGS